MTLLLEYTARTPIPVEVEGLIPSAVREKSLAEIERWEAFHGKEKVPLGELFQISGDPADERIEFQGELAGVHWIGARMDGGEIRVAGTAGRHVGSEMTAGTIVVEGDAGDWVGGELHGGTIHVRGRAGHLVGAAYRGSRRGMTGGTILIEAAAGNEIGHTLRRGLIAVGGAGDFAGVNMIAGTLLVLGPCGIRPGANMRRGTIGLFGPEPPRLLPSFRYACRYRPPFLPLLAAELGRHRFPMCDGIASAEVELFHGDLVTLGRGEILLPRR